MDELIGWLPAALTLTGVLVGYWIQQQIDRARMRRVLRHMFPPVVNTRPPTVTELHDWQQ